ncbi:hypothetical protein X753_18840 [Mesorhizobium sp. LNJC399B00]|nr:hypothetical protein X753_18840 [Mesorhizobium sp. LNJC399B00]
MKKKFFPHNDIFCGRRRGAHDAQHRLRGSGGGMAGIAAHQPLVFG